MALTEDLIKQNESLKTLSPEQIAVITTLSANDENTVIGNKIGELHGKYDNDILAVTGIAKNNGEKSYDYLKRAGSEIKTKADSATSLGAKITEHENKIKDYETQIREGKGSELINQKLKDAEQRLTQLQGQYDTDKSTFEKEKSEFDKTVSTIKIDSEFEKAISGLKFKATIPESVQSTLIKAAKDTVLSTNKDDWAEINGKKTLVFRDQNGSILNNPENKLNPFTPAELIAAQLKDVLDSGTQQKGAGTGTPDKTVVTLSDLTGVKTQVEADDLIAKHLLQKGILRGTQQFKDELTKIRKDNKIGELPIQ